MTRGFEFSLGEYYHVYNRGNNKSKIFLDQKDQARFKSLLYLCNNTKAIHLADIPKGEEYKMKRGEQLVDIGAFCIMFNHFHLLLKEKVDKGVSRFMQKISTAYSMFFNIKHGHVGTPFEGTYKGRHANSNSYLKYLFAYIHLNPAEHKFPDWKEGGPMGVRTALKYISKYEYSSLKNYLSTDLSDAVILNTVVFPNYQLNTNEVMNDLVDWLSYNEFNHEVKPRG